MANVSPVYPIWMNEEEARLLITLRDKADADPILIGMVEKLRSAASIKNPNDPIRHILNEEHLSL
jgi:hypothetical protein